MKRQFSTQLKMFWGWGVVLGLCLILGCAGRPPQSETQLIQQAETALSKEKSLQKILASGLQCSPKNEADYQVGSEDLLEVTVFGQEDLSRAVRVNAQGEINLPLIGVVPVAGHTPLEIANIINKRYGERYLRHPNVTVFVKEYRHQQVAVVGAVNKPGSYEMIGVRTLLEMISQAGGLKDEAGDVVHVIRDKSAAAIRKACKTGGKLKPETPETIVIDLRQLLTKGELELNIPIQHGDVISVPFAGYAYVTGEVKKPGKVPIKQDLSITEAIALVQGLKEEAVPSKTRILRFNPLGERQIIPVNLASLDKGQGPDLILRENDIVVVPSSVGRRMFLFLKEMLKGAFRVGYYVYP